MILYCIPGVVFCIRDGFISEMVSDADGIEMIFLCIPENVVRCLGLSHFYVISVF